MAKPNGVEWNDKLCYSLTCARAGAYAPNNTISMACCLNEVEPDKIIYFLLKAMWQDGVSSGRQVLFGYFLRRLVKSDKTKFKL
jgi:hypothetical protein